jgi:precorrin-2 dehydrogenase / sirohydrochlorin ferrochelatase
MNKLYPIFVKLEQLDVLLVGGGNIGLEKLTSILNNSPQVKLTIVADRILPEIWEMASNSSRIRIFPRKFEMQDMLGKDLVFLATDDRSLHEKIREEARKRKILLNVADTPDLCDFYLGSIVQKGDLKIAVSTNGKSPTIAKRIKEYLNDIIPEGIQDTLDQMSRVRNTIRGDFHEKVKILNRITSEWLQNKEV